jgi:hypothetical protein
VNNFNFICYYLCDCGVFSGSLWRACCHCSKVSYELVAVLRDGKALSRSGPKYDWGIAIVVQNPCRRWGVGVWSGHVKRLLGTGDGGDRMPGRPGPSIAGSFPASRRLPHLAPALGIPGAGAPPRLAAVGPRGARLVAPLALSLESPLHRGVTGLGARG